MDDPYRPRGRVHAPTAPVAHREEDFESRGFAQLRAMQERHFWYRGRHRFLAHALQRHAGRWGSAAPRVLDLGGGCGGWLTYLMRRPPFDLREVALADSSPLALEMAAQELPEEVGLYHADLLDLRWRDRWDVVFLLDVLEHVEDDGRALGEIGRALGPGGLLFVTTPAFPSLWSYNDEASGHHRRYRASDFSRLAGPAGLELIDARYFMFFLSPLLIASRLLSGPGRRGTSDAELARRVEAAHRVPRWGLNALLSTCFAAETPLGHVVRFPWGTSVLAVFRRT